MNSKNIFKITFIVLLIMFISLYVIGNSGLYDYQATRKKIMTEEEIEKFENDIKNGNKVDLEDYNKDKSDEYDNIISETTFSISKKIGIITEKGLKIILKNIEKVMNTEE